MAAKNSPRPATRADIRRLDSAVQENGRGIRRLDANVQKNSGDIKRLDSTVQKNSEDIRRLDATVQQMDQKIDQNTKRLAIEIVKTNGRIDDLSVSLRREMSENTRRILEAFEASVSRFEAAGRATLLHGQVLTEHSTALKDHDRRLTSLESRA